MTASVSAPASTRPRPRVATVLLWIVTIFFALGMTAAGSGKFRGNFWQTHFVGWGYPIWFSYVIGAAEMVCGICLLVPRLAFYAGISLAVIMTGAVVTVVTHPTPQFTPPAPVIFAVVMLLIALARWRDRLRLQR